MKPWLFADPRFSVLKRHAESTLAAHPTWCTGLKALSLFPCSLANLRSPKGAMELCYQFPPNENIHDAHWHMQLFFGGRFE